MQIISLPFRHLDLNTAHFIQDTRLYPPMILRTNGAGCSADHSYATIITALYSGQKAEDPNNPGTLMARTLDGERRASVNLTNYPVTILYLQGRRHGSQ